MSIENKQLTDSQLQSAFVTVSGNYVRNSDFDRGVFQEDLILKTIVGDDDKKLTIGEARLVLVNGEQVDFDDVADSISGDVWIVASRMLNHFKWTVGTLIMPIITMVITIIVNLLITKNKLKKHPRSRTTIRERGCSIMIVDV